MIRKFNIDANSLSKGFGLLKSAQYTTTRDAWKVNNMFEIVVDTTDFGHSVGEKELQSVTKSDGDQELPVAVRQAMAKDMDCQIEVLMRQYSWAFPPGKPIGTVLALQTFRKSCDQDGRGSLFSHSNLYQP